MIVDHSAEKILTLERLQKTDVIEGAEAYL